MARLSLRRHLVSPAEARRQKINAQRWEEWELQVKATLKAIIGDETCFYVINEALLVATKDELVKTPPSAFASEWSRIIRQRRNDAADRARRGNG